MQKNLFTLIPKVDDLLGRDRIKELLHELPRKIVLDSIREEIEILRNSIKEKNASEDYVISQISTIENRIISRIYIKDSYKLKRVVNATGVIIHTNLGRSLLTEKVMDNVKDIAINYSNLEYEIESGTRGSRYSHIEEILAELTGAESSMVVNNNAAAVLLALNTVAKGKEVIVSRGELIEIGGAFRIPDVMEQSGATLVSVGTTNKTHLEDYENAINDNTGALLKVHTSNYRILGFTSSVDSGELSILKERYKLPLIDDLGSGVLVDLSKYGLEYEPTVQESIKKGVDIVTFSGDKLLGGPQAGIIVGKREYIEKMKKNPLTRALRIDKFVVSALEASLKYYLDEESAIKEIPTLNMITMPLDTINKKALTLMDKVNSIDNKKIDVYIVDDYSEVGGGSMPLQKLPTKCLVLSLNNLSTQAFENNLRKFHIPIITRLYRNKIYMDLRTIREDEFIYIVEGINHALKTLEECS